MRDDLPSGTVTLLFTDIEGSTRLLEDLGDRFGEVLADHRRVLREAVGREGGVEVDNQGDGFFFVFRGAGEALAAARAAQDALAGVGVRVRMGVHTGEPALGEEGYVGMDVHRAARICAAASGGQVLVSETTAPLVGLAGLRDLGLMRLKDLSAPQRIYQMGELAFPPVRALRKTNLPVVASALVGRRRELHEIACLMETNRLVTLMGAGGVGKTRLALQAAADASHLFADGVWWVPLAAVRDSRLVVGSIAAAVGSGTDVSAFLEERSALIVLDNVEHVIDSASELSALLETAPGLHLLATSRAPLHLAHERRYPVAPMPGPEAEALFVERAQAIDPDVPVDAAVGQICARLDNLPLAIELAAARVSVLPPDALLGRLGDALGLLTGGARDQPERQRTLRATIDWSHNLLTSQEQMAFRRLSVFAGGCELEAAEQVCETDLETLTGLVEKSLVRRWSNGRLVMLEVVREYARERLAESGEDAAVADRHLGYYLDLAEREIALYPLATRELTDRLTNDLGNLRAASDRALAQRGEAALRFGAALAGFWLNAELYADARAWLAAAPLDHERVPPQYLMDGLAAASTLATFAATDAGLVDTYSERGLRLARKLADRRKEAQFLNRRATAAALDHRLDEALRALNGALVIAEELNDDALRRICLHRLGEVHRDRGEFPEARNLLGRSLSLSIQLNDGFATNTEHSLADLALDAGDFKEALRRYAFAMRPSSRRDETYCIAGIAAALTGLGDHAAALRLWACVEREERTIGFRMLQDERSRYERWIKRAASALDPAQTERVRGRAKQAEWEETLADALALARHYAS